MRKYSDKDFINEIVTYFKANEKQEATLIGVEFEHFIIHEDSLKSYAYDEPNGQRDLLEKLAKQDWNIILEEEGQLLGLEKQGTTITLEPGGQLEISLRAFDHYKDIDQTYRQIVGEINALLVAGQCLALIGYHPRTTIAELPLLPKARYEAMYDYFKENGAFCHHMMKGTCSTQVSIDYTSEADFIKKVRVANFLSPILASLFDATPIFEGQVYKAHNARVKVWEDTDIKRSKLVPGVMDKAFGYADYANYILNMEPIVMEREGQVTPTGRQTVSDLLKDYTFESADLLHFLGMVFPDVRVKNYIEIRMPDAMPYPYNMAIPLIIKTLFYDEQLLEKYAKLSEGVTDQWVKAANQAIIKSSSPIVEGRAIDDYKQMIIEDTLMHLEMEEKRPLMMFNSILRQYGSVKTWLLEQYERNKQAFVQMVKCD